MESNMTDEEYLLKSMLFPHEFLDDEPELDKGYNVIWKGKVLETFDNMREAEEFIDYKCKRWPLKYDEDAFNIKKG